MEKLKDCRGPVIKSFKTTLSMYGHQTEIYGWWGNYKPTPEQNKKYMKHATRLCKTLSKLGYNVQTDFMAMSEKFLHKHDFGGPAIAFIHARIIGFGPGFSNELIGSRQQCGVRVHSHEVKDGSICACVEQALSEWKQNIDDMIEYFSRMKI